MPAAKAFYEILAELKNIKLADAAAPLANPALVRATCLDAGFKSVEVRLPNQCLLTIFALFEATAGSMHLLCHQCFT